MQFPMFQTTDELLTVILVIVAFSLWVQRFRVFKYVGPALTVILIGLTLVNLRIVPGYQDVYGVVITYCVPMSISIYLLNINLKQSPGGTGMRRIQRLPGGHGLRRCIWQQDV